MTKEEMKQFAIKYGLDIDGFVEYLDNMSEEEYEKKREDYANFVNLHLRGCLDFEKYPGLAEGLKQILEFGVKKDKSDTQTSVE